MRQFAFLNFRNHLLKHRSFSFLQENGRMIAQFLLTILFIGLALWFVFHEKAELLEVKKTMLGSQWQYILLGVGLTIFYILLQGKMYCISFRTVNAKVPLWPMIILFLKRNFISVFLPAGGVSSLAFFVGDIEKRGFTKSQIHFASSVYGFAGIGSVVVIAIPALLCSMLVGTISFLEIFLLLLTIFLLAGIYFSYRSIKNGGFMYRIFVRFFPSLKVIFNEFSHNQINQKQFIYTFLISISIDFIGIAHIFVSMLALSVHPSLGAAVISYLVAVLFLTVSPFLRGLGAIEFSMSYILIQLGYSNIEAISITLLYRFFEFWLVFATGIYSFVAKVNKLVLRILPALFIFLLGIWNVLSVLLQSHHFKPLYHFLPLESIVTSNYFVLTAGLFLFITAAFLLKGLRSAWWMAFILVIISLAGHLSRAANYKDIFIAFIVLIVLIATRKEYNIKNNSRLRYVGLQTAFLSMVGVLIYGTIGFYFLDKKYFAIDFSLPQSIKYTFLNYFLIGSNDLKSAAPFARDFIISINISGLLSMMFLFYTIIRPFVIKNNSSPEQLTLAKSLVEKYGRSSLDYFKTYYDKMIFISDDATAFISYRVAGSYAVALENPVAENDLKMSYCIKEFDRYCNERGMKIFFYRVPEEDLAHYKALHKKCLFTGQEGVVDLEHFTLEGRSNKSLRNSIHKVTQRGYTTNIITPPIKDGLLQKLKSVSDEWLDDTGRKEIVFSQGLFRWDELKQQSVITVENKEEKIIAFLNIIPDYSKGEMTYDLLRKTVDAPNGVMDFVLIALFNYAKSLDYSFVNLGFAPLSGLEDPQSFPERSMKFAYEKIRLFAHYKGLREFKEKYSPIWHNKYLVYESDYDLLQAPMVLTKVIQSRNIL